MLGLHAWNCGAVVMQVNLFRSTCFITTKHVMTRQICMMEDRVATVDVAGGGHDLDDSCNGMEPGAAVLPSSMFQTKAATVQM